MLIRALASDARPYCTSIDCARRCAVVARFHATSTPRGVSVLAIAISDGTAKLHLHHIYTKLNLRGRVELVRYMQRHGLD